MARQLDGDKPGWIALDLLFYEYSRESHHDVAKPCVLIQRWSTSYSTNRAALIQSRREKRNNPMKDESNNVVTAG